MKKIYFIGSAVLVVLAIAIAYWYKSDTTSANVEKPTSVSVVTPAPPHDEHEACTEHTHAKVQTASFRDDSVPVHVEEPQLWAFIEGTVTDSTQHPAEGTLIKAFQLVSKQADNFVTREKASFKTNADGKFSLGPLDAGSVLIKAVRNVPGKNRLAVLKVEVSAGERKHQDIELGNNGGVEGSVKNSSGDPVVGQRVQLFFEDGPTAGTECTTDEKGVFSFEGINVEGAPGIDYELRLLYIKDRFPGKKVIVNPPEFHIKSGERGDFIVEVSEPPKSFSSFTVDYSGAQVDSVQVQLFDKYGIQIVDLSSLNLCTGTNTYPANNALADNTPFHAEIVDTKGFLKVDLREIDGKLTGVAGQWQIGYEVTGTIDLGDNVQEAWVFLQTSDDIQKHQPYRYTYVPKGGGSFVIKNVPQGTFSIGAKTKNQWFRVEGMKYLRKVDVSSSSDVGTITVR